MRRRDVVGVRRPGAEPLAFERARDQRLERRVRSSSASTATDRRRGAGGAAAEAARQRQSLADAQRDAAPLAERRQQRLRGDAGRVARRLARQPAVVAGDVDRSATTASTLAGAKRAVTSSPGASSAKPSTSKPHATFDTVAGAKAVTTSISHDAVRGRLRWSE